MILHPETLNPSFCIKASWSINLYCEGVSVESIANFEDELCDLCSKYFNCRTIEIANFNIKPYSKQKHYETSINETSLSKPS